VIDFVKLRLGLWRKNQTKKEVVTIPIQAEHLLVGSRVDVDLISPRVPNDDKQIV
jgi:hypothetical protein